jgi:GST-like protein
VRWAAEIASRPAVMRGKRVNKPGDAEDAVKNRHDASDLD